MKASILMTVAFISVLSLPAFSATEITRKESVRYVKVGNISVSGKTTSDEAIAALQKRTVEAGARYFLVSSLTMPGDSSKWSANAVIYNDR